ncbi:hypothetical protein [Glaciimonas soli]|uniref:hypothetical protein n=1 Tax=Glaciimonas soli TaxID=2590999 RepID=UPI003898E24C
MARIAQTHISRIAAILDTPENTKEIASFDEFLTELQDDLNDSTTKAEAIEMLACWRALKFDQLGHDSISANKRGHSASGMMGNLRTSLRFIFSRPRYLAFFWLVQFFFLALIET